MLSLLREDGPDSRVLPVIVVLAVLVAFAGLVSVRAATVDAAAAGEVRAAEAAP